MSRWIFMQLQNEWRKSSSYDKMKLAKHNAGVCGIFLPFSPQQISEPASISLQFSFGANLLCWYATMIDDSSVYRDLSVDINSSHYTPSSVEDHNGTAMRTHRVVLNKNKTKIKTAVIVNHFYSHFIANEYAGSFITLCIWGTKLLLTRIFPFTNICNIKLNSVIIWYCHKEYKENYFEIDWNFNKKCESNILLQHVLQSYVWKQHLQL